MGLDLRQHLTSLVAVFLALVAGIFIGISLSQEDRLEGRMNLLVEEFKWLREENLGLRQDLKRAEEELQRRAALEKAILPTLVKGKAEGLKVAIVYMDDAKKTNFECELREALAFAGASVVCEASLGRDFVGAVERMRPEQAANAGLVGNPSVVGVAGRLAELIASGNTVGLRELDSLGVIQGLTSHSAAPEAVVLFAAPEEEEQSRLQTVDQPLVDALVAGEAFVAIGLAKAVPPALANYYRRKGAVLVEAANTIPGQVELMELLEERLR